MYFTTLWESAPGDGTINLQLARLAAKEGNESQAILHYQSALDGTWQGNGYDRRREVRLEMARYLISRRELNAARTQLLIAAGNAPDDPAIKLEIAGLLEQAAAPQDALGIYRALAARHDPPVAALEGAGRTAFALGMYRLAGDSLNRALNSPLAAGLPDNQKSADRELLDTSHHVLDLYPGFDLAPRSRAERVLSIRKIAHQRLTSCTAFTTSSGNGQPRSLAGTSCHPNSRYLNSNRSRIWSKPFCSSPTILKLPPPRFVARPQATVRCCCESLATPRPWSRNRCPSCPFKP